MKTLNSINNYKITSTLTDKLNSQLLGCFYKKMSVKIDSQIQNQLRWQLGNQLHNHLYTPLINQLQIANDRRTK
jgi:hypothetical protein